MKKAELKIRTTEVTRVKELYQLFKSELEKEGILIDSAEEEEIVGMTGTEVVLSIILSVASSAVYDLLKSQVNKAAKKIKSRSKISIELELPPEPDERTNG